MVQNSLQNRPKFSVVIQKDSYKKLVNDTLGDPERARRFVAAISSAVAVNPALQECDPGSILTGALLGESLNLSPSPQLGQYYLVPYNDKRKGKVAQFQMGYKGYIQLAVRSSYYRKIVVLPIKAGELVRYDPLEEELSVRLIENDDAREAAPTMGYYAMFEYIGGTFRKTMYWSREKMIAHADRYSPAFSRKAFENLDKGLIPQDQLWKYSSFWYKDFDAMASKTMLRQLISKWGIMSIDLQKAYTSDGAYIRPDGSPEYFDAPEEEAVPETPAVDPDTGEVLGEGHTDEGDPLNFFGGTGA